MKIFYKIVAASLALLALVSCNTGRKDQTLNMDNLPLVFENDDVVFHAIDEHTWVGNGHLVYHESVYVVEGEDRALLIDAGMKMDNLDKIVAGITDKPLTLVLTHNHGDHVGAVGCFDELWVGELGGEQKFAGYDGKVNYLQDHQIFDLGGRTIEVFNTPGHTQESVIFIDEANHCAFSGDAFGSTNLLMTLDVSTFLKTAEETLAMMTEKGITIMYPGHFGGDNPETVKRIQDLRDIASGVLSGEMVGETSPGGMGLDRIVTYEGVRFNYNSKRVK